MLIYDIGVGVALAIAIWLAAECRPARPTWRESHRRVKRKAGDEGA